MNDCRRPIYTDPHPYGARSPRRRSSSPERRRAPVYPPPHRGHSYPPSNTARSNHHRMDRPRWSEPRRFNDQRLAPPRSEKQGRLPGPERPRYQPPPPPRTTLGAASVPCPQRPSSTEPVPTTTTAPRLLPTVTADVALASVQLKDDVAAGATPDLMEASESTLSIDGSATKMIQEAAAAPAMVPPAVVEALESVKRASQVNTNETTSDDKSNSAPLSPVPPRPPAKSLPKEAVALLEESLRLSSSSPLCDPRIAIGTRLEIYWDGEDAWFAGTLVGERPHKKRRWFIDYDDGDQEWINLNKDQYRIVETTNEKELVETDNEEEASLPETTRPKKKKRLNDQMIRKSNSTVSEKSAVSKTSSEESSPEVARPLKKKKKKRVMLNAAENGVKTDAPAHAPSAGTRPPDVASVEPSKPSVAKDWSSQHTVPLKKRKKLRTMDHGATADAAAAEKETRKLTSGTKKRRKVTENPVDDWVAAGIVRDPDDSETDEEEVMQFAARMFGIEPRPMARRRTASPEIGRPCELAADFGDLHENIFIPISEAVKLGRRRRSCNTDDRPDSPTISTKALVKKKKVEAVPPVNQTDEAEAAAAKAKKEAARPLTSAEIKKILAEDDMQCNSHTARDWVRRSVRQPSRSALSTPLVKSLMDKLRSNDTDMVVLKLKKYLSSPDTPQILIDATLDALEENTNCEALYIQVSFGAPLSHPYLLPLTISQNFNEGMRDAQVLHLLEVLKRPSCKIWCLNIGETYNVKTRTWEKFADGLKDTQITHMYTSEHTISTELKDQIRATIRDNRGKHNMHCDPENLDTIVQCTHCWWNPINTKSLRPYLKKKGYEHILHDKNLQGLRGTDSADQTLK